MIPQNNFPLELRRHTVDSIHILKVIVFRTPFNFCSSRLQQDLPSFSHIEHRVGEDVGFVVGDLISSAAQ